MAGGEQQNYWGDLTWKTRLPIAAASYCLKASCRSDALGTILRRLATFLNLKTPPSLKPIDGVSTSDFIVDPSRNLWFRLFVPENHHASNDDHVVQLPVMIYFHGGGFALMQADSRGYDTYCRRLAKEIHCVVMSVNYGLTPEHKYPSQYDDGFDALKFIDNNKNLFKFANLNQCFLAGDSAGGNLAHFVALKASERRDFHSLKVIGIVSIQPFYGGEERTESELKLVKAPIINMHGADWMWEVFLPEGANRDHPAVNVFGPNGFDISKVEGFPATIVFVAAFDPLHDWQIRYYQGLKKAGKEAYLVEYSNTFHAFYSIPELKESGLLIEEVRIFMKKQAAKYN